MKNLSNNLDFKEKINDIFSKQNRDNLIQKIKNKFILHPSQFQVTVYFLKAIIVIGMKAKKTKRRERLFPKTIRAIRFNNKGTK